MTKQRAFVTAGASGIGRIIAKRFRRSGAEVHVCDVDEKAIAALSQEEPEIRAIRADVSAPADVERFFGSVSENGAFEVLVNNAGIAGPRAEIDGIDVEEWRRTIDVNLTGAFLCLRQAAKRMKQARAGAVVNIVTASVRTGLPCRLPYIASKAGLLGINHNAARELGPYGIRVNAVLPGIVDGPRSRAVLEKVAASKGITPEVAAQEALRTVSMRTMVQPEEVADMVHWLASAEASHVTGQEIAVDGNLEWEE